MSRNLIDRDALIASIPKTNVDIFEDCRNCSTLCDWQVRELIEHAELVDAVEVKHGEWIPNSPFTGNCSECGGKGNLKDSYCSNCGTKMDGEEQNNERI